METKPTPNPETVDTERRDFLRNSVYAAYATPLITALLVEKASAATSNPRPLQPRVVCEQGPLLSLLLTSKAPKENCLPLKVLLVSPLKL